MTFSSALDECFWLDAVDTGHLEPPVQGNEEAEVVLVGGGYTSLVAAYFLKRQCPEMDMAVLESDYLGFGSSGRNAGMVLHELHTDRLGRHGPRSVRFTYDQAVAAIDTIEEISRESGFDCELERTGYLKIAVHPAHLRKLAKIQASYGKLGVELPLLNGEEIQAAVRSRRFKGALRFPQAAMLHPGKYVAGLKQAIKKAGVRIYEQTRVTAIREGAELEVITSGGTLRSPNLVLGLNAYWADNRFGILRDRAVSLLSFIILTEPLPDDLWKELGWSGRQGYSDARRIHNYVRVTGKRILFGGRVAYHFGMEAPAGRERIYDRLYQEMLETFPCLEGVVSITHRWCGPVAITRRHTPLIGRTGKKDNIYYAMGYSGMGASLATLAGRVLADLVRGEDRRWQDLLYLRDRTLPLPPEPLRFLAFQGSYHGMRLLDGLDRWR